MTVVELVDRQLDRAQLLRDQAAADLAEHERTPARPDTATWQDTWARLRAALDRSEAGLAVARRQAADNELAAQRRALAEDRHADDLRDLTRSVEASVTATSAAIRAAQEHLDTAIRAYQEHVQLLADTAQQLHGWGLTGPGTNGATGHDFWLDGDHHALGDHTVELLAVLHERAKTTVTGRSAPCRPSLALTALGI